MIQVLDKKFSSFLTADEIQQRIAELATEINTDYKGKKITFVVILNGAFMFASDLLKQIDVACEIHFVKVKSYEGMKSTGQTKEVIGLATDVSGKDVIVVEDIVDTGITIDGISNMLRANNCNSVKIASLLFKPTAFQGVNEPHYVGFSIENKFVVGYGLDYDDHGRNLDAIFQLNE